MTRDEGAARPPIVVPAPEPPPEKPPTGRATVVAVGAALALLLVAVTLGVAVIASRRGTSPTTSAPRTRPSPLQPSRSPARSSPPLRDATVQRIVTAASPSVVSVEGVACDEQVAGTGWFASSDLVVTNAHVVAGVGEPTVTTSQGQRARSSVVTFDPENDIAVLRVSVTGSALQASPTDPPPGASAVAVAFQSDGIEARTGSVTRLEEADSVDIYDNDIGPRKVVILDMVLVSGDSGSPVFDATGRVIGTAAASDPENDRIGFAVPNSEVAADVAAARSRTQPVSTGACIPE